MKCLARMNSFRFKSVEKKHIISAFFIITFLFVLESLEVTADNDNNNKKVPAFFLKIAKNIPRMGRSQSYDYVDENTDEIDNPTWHRVSDEISDVSKRKIGFSPESDTRNWQHFPLAIEGPPELWKSLASYTHDPLYRVTDNDFNNELWLQDKRENSPLKL